jgi:hypothetical protein
MQQAEEIISATSRLVPFAHTGLPDQHRTNPRAAGIRAFSGLHRCGTDPGSWPDRGDGGVYVPGLKTRRPSPCLMQRRPLMSLRIKLITWEQFGDGAFATASVRSP